MRIVHFLYDSPENPWLGGGGAIRAQEINQRLVAKGHEIHMICGGYPGASNRDWIQNGVHWHSCVFYGNYALSRLLFSLQCRRRFRGLQKEMSFDLIVEDSSPFSFIASWTISNIPRITLFQNWMSEQLKKKMGAVGLLFSFWERYTARKSQRIIAVSSHLKEQLQLSVPLVPCDIVYNGVSEDCFEQVEKRMVSVHDTPIILFIGRIDIYQKGLDLLLESFEQVLKVFPLVQLQIAGSGRDKNRLNDMLKDVSWRQSVLFLGKGGKERFSWIQNADIVVMPSRFEGWGIVALEAQTLGVPVVATNIPGLSEAVLHQKTGWLCEVNAQSISEGLLTLLNDTKLRETLSKNGQEHAKFFRWDSIANAQESVYLNRGIH